MKVSNEDLIRQLTKTLESEGRDPMFIVGYLQAILIHIVDGSSKKYQKEIAQELNRHLSIRKKTA